jgi:hypothetical protein
VLLVGSSIALALYAVVALQRSATAFYAYPVASIDQLEVAGLVGPGVDARLVAPDYVGNYLSARYGDDAHSFIDDRYDLFPLDLIDDYGTLVRVDSDPGEVLDRYEADLVLWRLDRPLNDWLDESEEWAVADVTPDERWTIHCRVGSDAESFCAAS